MIQNKQTTHFRKYKEIPVLEIKEGYTILKNHGFSYTVESIKKIFDGRGVIFAESPNDFKEKIGPGIKDLIKDKRNFVLVIPEMAHSRGYGTGPDDDERFLKISKGKK